MHKNHAREQDVPAARQPFFWRISAPAGLLLAIGTGALLMAYVDGGDPARIELLPLLTLQLLAAAWTFISLACLAYSIVASLTLRGTWRTVAVVCGVLTAIVTLLAIAAILTAVPDVGYYAT